MIAVAELLFTYLRIGLMGSVMILVVLLARPLLCKTTRNISCALWLLVVLRLLLPFQLESPLSLQPSQLAEFSVISQSIHRSPVDEYQPIANIGATPSTDPVISENPVPSTRVQPEWIISALWICGSVAVLLYVTISYGILRYRMRDAVRSSDDAWESERISGAFLLGYFRPRICIPPGLHPQDRRFIIAHENAHLQRGDHWWKLLGMLCLSIHWYNPLVWLGYAFWCRDIEVACDERVIRSMELEERKSYSFALLNCGKRLSGFLAYPVAFGEINLKSRIKSVLSYRKPGVWITAMALILTTLVAVCFMTTPITTATAIGPEPEQSFSVVETIDIPITETVPTTEPARAPVNPTEPTEKPETAPIPHPEPTPEPPTENTVPTTPPVETKQPETTQTTVTEPPVEEPFIPSVTIPTDIDFSKIERVDTLPQLPDFQPPSYDKEENQYGYDALFSKEPVKTGVELPRVIIWEDPSPKPGYPVFP